MADHWVMKGHETFVSARLKCCVMVGSYFFFTQLLRPCFELYNLLKKKKKVRNYLRLCFHSFRRFVNSWFSPLLYICFDSEFHHTRILKRKTITQFKHPDPQITGNVRDIFNWWRWWQTTGSSFVTPDSVNVSLPFAVQCRLLGLFFISPPPPSCPTCRRLPRLCSVVTLPVLGQTRWTQLQFCFLCNSFLTTPGAACVREGEGKTGLVSVGGGRERKSRGSDCIDHGVQLKHAVGPKCKTWTKSQSNTDIYWKHLPPSFSRYKNLI